MDRLIKLIDLQDAALDRIEQIIRTKPWDANAVDEIDSIIRGHHKAVAGLEKGPQK